MLGRVQEEIYGQPVSPLSGARPLEPAPPCPVCDAERTRLEYALEGTPWRVGRCPGCGLGRLLPLPSEEEVRAFYPPGVYGDAGEKFTSWVELPVRLVGARHIRFLTRGLPRGARVLDVGCGRGVLLRALADRGFEVHGVELSEAAVEGADPRAEVRIAPDLAGAGYAAGSFDQVVFWHVLEHLRDPRGALAEARRLLRPGGRLVVAVPNFSSLQARWAGAAWFHLDPPRHLFHFPAAALRRLLERTGLEPEAERHFSLRQNPFGWIQSALNRRSGLPRNGAYVLLHRRAGGAAPPFPAPMRRRLRLGYLAGLAPALALSAVCAALRTGATVTVVARRPRG